MEIEFYWLEDLQIVRQLGGKSLNKANFSLYVSSSWPINFKHLAIILHLWLVLINKQTANIIKLAGDRIYRKKYLQ
jgi:hypothetical protein